jgi:hypothetical protein
MDDPRALLTYARSLPFGIEWLAVGKTRGWLDWMPFLISSSFSSCRH